MNIRRLFIDLDGVLADFDSHYHECFGVRLDRNGSEPPDLWQNVRARGDWFRSLPVMPDARVLWEAVAYLRPTILTGLSAEKYPAGEAEKRAWVAEHFGADVPVIVCRSRHKAKHGQSGDVLVDDWKKYRHLWEEMGGVFVLHTSAATSVEALEPLFREHIAHHHV
jgi:5'(3')-deoxyribonucleotidase